ncbi:MAG: hypothetical protein L0Y32_02780 [Nevskiales bacterium]|nr:hypothetical protein [Nevskiales bacterium]
MRKRRNHYDVTNTVEISNPAAVCDEVCRILGDLYPKAELLPVRKAFGTFAHLYAGVLPGYRGCDTWYHDAQHSLDCTLALARLLDGHERAVRPSMRLGARRARLGVILALFHDSGYIRRYDESHFRNGAEFTLYHVSRSGDFLAECLPTLGYAREVELARRLVHFTGYEIALSKIAVKNRRDRKIGHLLGTADLIAQMSDRCYPEKCRRYLYHEFTACGLAGPARPGLRKPLYESPDDLMRKTPGFVRTLFTERLNGHFEGAYRFAAVHFRGTNRYLNAIRQSLSYIRKQTAVGLKGGFRRRPRSINARALRQILKLRISEYRPQRVAAARSRSRTRARRVPDPAQVAVYLPV